MSNAVSPQPWRSLSRTSCFSHQGDASGWADLHGRSPIQIFLHNLRAGAASALLGLIKVNNEFPDQLVLLDKFIAYGKC